jgi:hypothetical protein
MRILNLTYAFNIEHTLGTKEASFEASLFYM